MPSGGGGYVIVTLMKKKFVDEYHWIDEKEMLDLIAIAQSSPGAIAVNGAIVVGYKLAGILGAMTAIIATILPPLVIISVISVFYNQFHNNVIVSQILTGMQAAVGAIIADVVYGMASGVVKEKKAAQRKERLAQFKAGDVVEGTVDNIKDYGAFVKLADGIDGLLHISQISTQRIKHPGAVLKEGQTVKVKILSIADGKISLSMKALIEQETEEEEHETFDYKETAAATTGLGDLLKGLKL